MRLFSTNHRAIVRRAAAVVALLALLAGWSGWLSTINPQPAAAQATVAAGGRKVFLPLVASGQPANQPGIASAGLSFSVSVSPAKQVAPGALLRAEITATNSGAETLTFRDVTLRYNFAQLAYERAEGERMLVISQSGDFTTAAFRRIGPGETVAGTLLFRVRDGLPDGATITLTPEYFCAEQLCIGNLVQVQVSSATLSTESLDNTQELLVAPTTGGAETVFRFTSRKFSQRDRVQLWLGNNAGTVRPLAQEYRVGADGWLRFELKGSEFGPGSWNLLAYGSLTGFTSIASFTVSTGVTPVGQGPAASTDRTPETSSSILTPPVAPQVFSTPVQQRGEGGLAGRAADAASGEGVADVLIVVLQEGRPVASARTRADGGYLIPVGLATGSYTVRALAASAGGALAFQDASYPQPVAVSAPELTSGIDFALVRGGAIAGRVTAGDTRRGLSGVGVEVLDDGALVGSGTTDAGGGYRVEGLPEGVYTLRFVTETGADGDVVAYAGGTIPGVAVSAGTTVFADTSLNLRPTVAKLRGRVSGAGGGLPGVIVAVFDAEAELVDLTLTQADGRYATGPLANGSYRVAFVTFFSESPATRRHIGAFFGGGTSFAGATPVTVGGPGVIENISTTLALGGQIGGAVRGENGTALAGVLVAAFDAGGAAQAVGQSGADGSYTLPGLAAGSYRVGYFAEYAGDAAVRRYQDSFYNGKASLAEADPVEVTAGQTLAGIDGSLALGGAIAGRVTADDGGAGLVGVVVIAINGAGGIAAAALTGADGGYELPGLTPGPHTLLFDTIFAPGEVSRGYIDEAFDNRREAPFTPVNVTVGGTTTANAGLARGGQIAGRVTAVDSGLGLRGVAVLVYSGDTLVSFTMTDASGLYTTSGLPAAGYTVRFDPTLSSDQETEQYAAQTLPTTVAVTTGAVTPGVNAALVRP